MKCTEGLGVAGLPAPRPGQAGRLSGQLLEGASSQALRLLRRVLGLGEPGRLGTGHRRWLSATPQEVLFGRSPPPTHDAIQ